MGLKVSDIKDIILKNCSGVDISQQVVNRFDNLIENDRACVNSENQVSPRLWECRWLTDQKDSTQYYKKGDSVWINTDTEDMILVSRRNEISSYVTQDPNLSRQFEKINKDDSYAVNEYFKKVINGTACEGVSALYYIGDITKPAQIKVSRKDRNSDYPDVSSSWYDFYIPITREDCEKEIEDCLDQCTNDQLSSHISEYHGKDISRKTISERYLLQNSEAIREDAAQQYFYNHQFFKSMNGFDYVVKCEYNGQDWYRLWNSGYLEQGGYVKNDGKNILRAEFRLEYNYPYATNFYQIGYDKYEGQNVEGTIDFTKRYCATVTPIVHSENDAKPYQTEAKDTNGNKTYTCVDITKMDNDGFSFVNVDTEKKNYGSYCYSVCGFRTVNNQV